MDILSKSLYLIIHESWIATGQQTGDHWAGRGRAGVKKIAIFIDVSSLNGNLVDKQFRMCE